MNRCPAAFRLADGTIATCDVDHWRLTQRVVHESDDVDSTTIAWSDDSPFATEDPYIVEQNR